MLDPEELSNVHAELLFLLRASNPRWERLEQIYELMGTQAPKDLIIALAKHILAGWSLGATTCSPLELNCLIAFTALGCEIKAEHSTHMRNLIQQNGLSESPFPDPLEWSSHALLTVDPSASMDAPVVTAWIYTENNLPREVIICGKGAGWIHNELDYAILVASMMRTPKDTDILVEGFTRLFLDQEEMAALSDLQSGIAAIIGNTAGSAALAQFLLNEDKPVAVLYKMIDRLEQLSKTTGLVQVFHRPYTQRSEFINALDEKTNEAAHLTSTEIHVWQPNLSGDRRVLVPIPLPELALEFSYEFADNPCYLELHDLYQNETIRVAAVDALRRINFYTGQLAMHSESLKAYRDPQRRPQLPEPVVLTHRIDYPTGLMYRLDPPENISRDEYYGVHVPQMVKKDIEWTEKMRDLIKDIARAVSSSDSGLNRQTMTRLFDGAMRNLPLQANQIVLDAYQTWKAQVQPLLWKLWYEKLAEAGLSPEQVHTRQMIFNLNVDQENKKIRMLPHFVTDSQTSVIAVDSRHAWIPIIYSRYDCIEEKPLRPRPDDALAFYQSWQNQAHQGDDSASITDMLRSALIADPRAVIARVLQDYAIPRPSYPELEEKLTNVAEKVALLYSYGLALRLWSKNAYHSAIAVLEDTEKRFEQIEPKSPFFTLADIPFTLAYFKAMFEWGSEMIRNMEGLLKFKSPQNATEREIQRLLLLAQKRDHGYVRKSLERESPVRSEAWYRLQNFEFLSEAEKIHLNALRAIVYLQVAERFSEGVDQFDLTGESPRSIYAKIGPAIQSAWISRFLEDSSDELEDLFNLLLGEEMK